MNFLILVFRIAMLVTSYEMQAVVLPCLAILTFWRSGNENARGLRPIFRSKFSSVAFRLGVTCSPFSGPG